MFSKCTFWIFRRRQKEEIPICIFVVSPINTWPSIRLNIQARKRTLCLKTALFYDDNDPCAAGIIL